MQRIRACAMKAECEYPRALGLVQTRRPALVPEHGTCLSTDLNTMLAKKFGHGAQNREIHSRLVLNNDTGAQQQYGG